MAEPSIVRRGWLLLRAGFPLLVVAMALLGGPTLLAWRLLGGPFGWRPLLIGGAISVAIFVCASATLGWALGRLLTGKRGR